MVIVFSKNIVHIRCFLREPLERYVSEILIRIRSTDQVVSKIKERVRIEREVDHYWLKGADYLLIPSQRVSNDNLDVGQFREWYQMQQVNIPHCLRLSFERK